MFSKFQNYLRIMIKVFEFNEMDGHFIEVAGQHSRHVPGEKCIVWKKQQKTLNISDMIQAISSSLRQNNHTVSGHLMHISDDLENVGRGKNLQNSHFWHANISLKTSNIKSR